MVAQNVAFAILAAVMIGSALKVVTTDNIVHAALFLVMVLAGVAGQFILLGGEFVGATQVLVYIGAVVVLFLFGIMLTQATFEDRAELDLPNRGIAAFVALGLLGIMSYALIDFWRDTDLPENTRTVTAEVSGSIFSRYLVGFEALSVLLLAALIGAIVVARRD